MDYSKFYDLNEYLFKVVIKKFKEQHYIDAFDFFCIIIWKANRAKTKIYKKIKNIAKSNDINGICKEITLYLYKTDNKKERLRYLIQKRKFNLPMASAILSVLFPNEYTVYDIRVCKILEKYEKLANKTNVDTIITEYFNYLTDVEKKVPSKNSFREKDKFLWGQSFYLELSKDIENGFIRLEKKEK